jgi:hypothetical protein
MRPLHYYLIAALCLATGTTATAQRRGVGDLVLLPEVQAELALKGDDYVLLGVRGPLKTEGTKGLERLGFNLGYERFWNQSWSGGATLRADFYEGYGGGDVSKLYTDLTPELFVRHWNTLGRFHFRQRFGVEYFSPGGENTEGRALTRLHLDLERPVPIGTSGLLRPRLAYEAVAFLRLQRDEDEPRERFIDFGTLRAEVGVRVSPHLDFTPWVASQTTYINALPQYDVNGNETAGGRTNLVTPVVGLDVRLTLFRGGAPFERRQLPTQH